MIVQGHNLTWDVTYNVGTCVDCGAILSARQLRNPVAPCKGSAAFAPACPGAPKASDASDASSDYFDIPDPAAPAKAPWSPGYCVGCNVELCPPLDGDGANACAKCQRSGAVW